MSRVKKSAAIGVLAASFIGGAEGLRQNAYPDPATRGKPWTICYGHTGPDVAPGVHKSLDECKALLLSDLDERAGNQIEKCIPSLATAPPGRYVAVLSLAHNIGAGGVCRSSVARDLNAGRIRQACDDLLKFNRAAGFVMPGLTRRREQERRLCLIDAA